MDQVSKHLKWIVGGILLLAIGIFLLGRIGKVFVREVVEDVSIAHEATSDAAIGKAAPQFQLPDLSGNQSKLSDFLGSPLILTFWTTWNREAADEVKILDDYLSKNGENLFQVVAISNQEERSVVANFVQRGGYRVRVLLDEKGAVGEMYQARNLPVTYFIDKKGVLRDVFIGILSEKTLVEKIEKIVQ